MSFSVKTFASVVVLSALVSHSAQASDIQSSQVALPTLVSALVNNAVSATQQQVAQDVYTAVANAEHQFELNVEQATPRVSIVDLAKVDSQNADSQSE